MNTAIKRLQEYGVKPSVQRIAIMDYLLTHTNHPSVDTIYNDLIDKIPTLSRTTIYNTLKLLADTGAILSLNIEDNTIRYDGDITPHAHFKCTECGKVYDFRIEDNGVEKVQFSNDSGFNICERELYLKGICPECQKVINKK